MSLNTIASTHLLPVAVVAIGADAVAVGRASNSRYPAKLHEPSSVSSKNASKIAADVLGQLGSLEAESVGSVGLPAVVILASTGEATAVIEIIRALRAQAPTIRPRVWPTFVAGDPNVLEDFDAAVDELGTGACDLVLMMTGTASSSEKAAALGAWLHVKMPAPPSVLGELPDVEGRICRYVAIGSGTVNPQHDDREPAPLVGESNMDVAVLDGVIRAKVSEMAIKAVSVTAANDAASALCAAAEDLDPAALLQAENNLANALADVARQLSKSLSESLESLIAEEIDLLGDSTARDDVPASDAADESKANVVADVPADNRTAAVSQLVLLASKGGLSKMMSRSRMVGIAQSIGAAARRDVGAAVERAVTQVGHEIPDRIKSALVRREDRLADQRAADELESIKLVESVWREAMGNCRQAVALWPAVDTTGISRSWGGSVPAPRQYVVGSELALRALPEDDDALSVVDLRDVNSAFVAPNGKPRSNDGSIDLRVGTVNATERYAIVLLAQYGLPLAAFVPRGVPAP